MTAAEGTEEGVRVARTGYVVGRPPRGLPVDIEPGHPKSGHLITAVAAGWRHIDKDGTAKSPDAR